MNLWLLVSSIIVSLSMTVSSAYHLPLISVFDTEDGVTMASFEAVELDEQDLIPHKINNDSLGVKITAQAAAVMDKNTGLILWQKNAHQKRSIASITKLMTALVFLENNPGWDNEIEMVEEDEINGGTNRILRGEKVRIEDLFYTSLIASDNNATRALARSTGLSYEDFVAQMNKKAKDLSLPNTSFVDVTGLKDGNQSTALEVLQLAKTAFSKTDIRKAVSKASYEFQAISGQYHNIKSTNLLFSSFLDIEAGKTGFVNASGYCLVVELSSEEDNKSNIISVVLGSENHEARFQDLKILSSWVFDNFNWS